MSKLNFYHRLENELTGQEMSLVEYYIIKAQDLYDNDKDEQARDALEDAVAVLQQHGEYSAARKVDYYTRFT